MTGEYKVFKVDGGYEVYWCPSAPMHYADKISVDGRVYPQKQAAYRRRDALKKKLEARLESAKKQEPAVA